MFIVRSFVKKVEERCLFYVVYFTCVFSSVFGFGVFSLLFDSAVFAFVPFTQHILRVLRFFRCFLCVLAIFLRDSCLFVVLLVFAHKMYLTFDSLFFRWYNFIEGLYQTVL